MVRLRQGVPSTCVLIPVIFTCPMLGRLTLCINHSMIQDVTAIESPLGPHRTMHGQVVEWIGRRIVSGELTRGSQLPNEAELAAQLKVSRGGIREAVKALAA